MGPYPCCTWKCGHKKVGWWKVKVCWPECKTCWVTSSIADIIIEKGKALDYAYGIIEKMVKAVIPGAAQFERMIYALFEKIMPDISIPSFNLPRINLPSMPGFSLPGFGCLTSKECFSLPGFKFDLWSFNLPDLCSVPAGRPTLALMAQPDHWSVISQGQSVGTLAAKSVGTLAAKDTFALSFEIMLTGAPSSQWAGILKVGAGNLRLPAIWQNRLNKLHICMRTSSNECINTQALALNRVYAINVDVVKKVPTSDRCMRVYIDNKLVQERCFRISSNTRDHAVYLGDESGRPGRSAKGQLRKFMFTPLTDPCEVSFFEPAQACRVEGTC